MKNKVLTIPENYFAFIDSENENNVYAITKEMVEYKNHIMLQFGKLEKDVPDEYFVKAYTVGFIGELDQFSDEYNLTSNEPIDFPINRIKWMFIRIPR